jgi:hypothetical protein
MYIFMHILCIYVVQNKLLLYRIINTHETKVLFLIFLACLTSWLDCSATSKKLRAKKKQKSLSQDTAVTFFAW